MKLSSVLSMALALIVLAVLMAYGVTEEVPIGSYRGIVTMAENGKPLPNAFVTLTAVTPTGEEELVPHRFETDKEGRFALRNVPAGNYLLRVSAKAHQIEKKAVAVVEGRVITESLAATPIPYYLDLYASQRVYTPDESPTVQCKGFSKESALKIVTYKLDFDKVIKEGSLYNALAPLAGNNGKAKDPATMGAKLTSSNDEVKERDAEGTFIQKLNLSQLKEGIYWVECDLGGISKGTWLSVSKIAMVAKHVGKEVKCYVATLGEGQPVDGAELGYATANGYKPASKTKEGMGDMTVPATTGSDASSVVIATDGQSRAFVDFRQGEADATSYRMYAYSDRSIYRPGDLISFKGIVRKLVGRGYSMPGQSPVSVEFRDRQSTVLQTLKLSLNSMGSYSGAFQLSKEAEPGSYTIFSSCNGQTYSLDIPVAAYRKPLYTIKVHPEMPHYVRGETVRMFVDVQYYFGGPVIGAAVKADVYRNPLYSFEADEEGYSDEESDASGEGGSYGGEQTRHLDAKTDSTGRAVIEFNSRQDFDADVAAAQKQGDDTPQTTLDYTYNVDVSVQDAGNKAFDGSGNVEVYASGISLNLDSGTYIVDPGKTVMEKVTAKDLDGKPLSGVRVQVQSGYEHWNDRKTVMSDLKNDSVITGPDGAAQWPVAAGKEGELLLSATATDPKGNEEVATDYLTVGGGEFMYESGAQLSVKLDKKKYNVGDNAKAAIQCGNPGGYALVTIEGDRIYSSQLVKLDKAGSTVDVPVKDEYAPDAYVSVAYVFGKKFSESTKRLNVDIGTRKLKVEVASDRSTYRPGDTATYTIKTTNASGVPTPAEVSLSVVDESVYAILEDQYKIVQGFYPMRENAVETGYSFPDIYLGGADKAPTDIQVRQRFVDTAYWNPAIETDSQGQASVKVILPDNLTTWRATARGISANTEVGQTTEKVIARKDLMLRLEAPTFMTGSDSQRLAAIIMNNTGHDADVHLQVNATGLPLDGQAQQTVHVANGASQTVEFTAKPLQGGTASVEGKAWIDGGDSDGMILKVPLTPHGTLNSESSAGLVSGSETLKINVLQNADIPSGRLVLTVAPTIATSLMETVNDLVGFPYGCTEQTTSRFLPSVLVMKAVKEAGLPKPQLADKIPQIAEDSYTRLKSLQHEDGGWGWWKYDVSDPYMTAYVLEAAFRAEKAGYPIKLIDSEKAIEWATKYIQTSPQKDLSYITDQKWKETLQHQHSCDILYLTYALSLFGKTDEVAKKLDSLDLRQLWPNELAHVAMAYDRLGQNYVAKRDAAMQKLTSLAMVTPSTAHWDEEYWGYESTARAFMAIESIQPTNPIIPKIVVYLMQKRQGSFWFSTRDSALILIPMTDYLSRTKELMKKSQVTLRLNGVQISQLSFDPQATHEPQTRIEFGLDRLVKGENQLQIDANGGTAYYTTDLKQVAVEQGTIAAQDLPTLKIDRKYYVLEPTKMEDGTTKLMPTHEPVASAKQGDIIRVDVLVNAAKSMDYVMLVDPIPANCRVTEREDVPVDEWSFWWADTAVFDDHVSFFSTTLEPGAHTFSYNMRVENTGTAHAMPSVIYNMYDPGTKASSAENTLEVR